MIKMLDVEIDKFLDSEADLATVEEFYLELIRLQKMKIAKLEAKRLQMALEALDGEDSKEVGNLIVEYKSTVRFALDSIKLKSYFADLKINEDQMKNLIYSHSTTKPSLKIKSI